jgi:hypothetical protein
VDTTSELSAGKETRNRLVVAIVDGGVGADLETTHGVVEHGGLVLVNVSLYPETSRLTMSATWYASSILNSPPWKN